MEKRHRKIGGHEHEQRTKKDWLPKLHSRYARPSREAKRRTTRGGAVAFETEFN
jgi:hypothetical protein